jgi:hypothetical protein
MRRWFLLLGLLACHAKAQTVVAEPVDAGSDVVEASAPAVVAPFDPDAHEVLGKAMHCSAACECKIDNVRSMSPHDGWIELIPDCAPEAGYGSWELKLDVPRSEHGLLTEAALRDLALRYDTMPPNLRDPGCTPKDPLAPASSVAGDPKCRPAKAWIDEGGFRLESFCAPVSIYLFVRSLYRMTARNAVYDEVVFRQLANYQASTRASTLATPACAKQPVKRVYATCPPTYPCARD